MNKDIHMPGYCCDRFRQSVMEKKVIRSDKDDETEWFFPEWLHLYYCPFCGQSIKGEEWGEKV